MRLALATSVWGLVSSFISPPKGISHETKAWIDKSRQRWGVEGASVVVVTNASGMVPETMSFGVADRHGNKVTDETLFSIASNSKLFTMLAIGALIDNHTVLPNGETLDWDTKVKDILRDDWKLQDEYASDHMDITDLASMRSGIPSHDLAHLNRSAAEMTRLLRHLRFTSEIRQVWQYNNIHYNALAYIVTVLSGMELPEYVAHHILSPLNMTRTTYNSTTAHAWGDIVDGFTHVDVNFTKCIAESHGARNMSKACKGRTVPVGWWTSGDAVAEAGPGGVITCAKDLGKWLTELLSPATLSAPLLTKLATPIMYMGLPALSPHLTAPAYGMGQMTQTYRGHEIVFHTGGLPGQTSLILRAPNDGIALAILTNDERALSFFYSAAFRILDELLGLDFMDWKEIYFKEELDDMPKPQPKGDTPASVSVAGRYSGEGYGELSIAELGEGLLQELVLDKFTLFGLPTDQPIFVTPFRHLFTTHLAFTHKNASIWHCAVLKVHEMEETADDIPGREVTPKYPVVAAFINFQAVVTADGMGMFGRFSVPGPLARLAQPSEKDVQARSEVWFERLQD